MANRSHVYVTDVVPTKKGKSKKGQYRGVGEWNYDIPIAHQLLASVAPRRCVSAIWAEHEIGILAERKGGVARLLAFLDHLGGSGKLAHANEYTAAVAETRKFLGAKARQGKWILLEAGEIFDMSGNELGDECAALVDDVIPATAARVERALAGGEKPWLGKLRKSWREQLGLYWSDVLYYSP